MHGKPKSFGTSLAEVILRQDRLAFLRDCCFGDPPLDTRATFHSVYDAYPTGDSIGLPYVKGYSNVCFSSPNVLWVKPEVIVQADFREGPEKVFLVDFSMSPGSVSGIRSPHDSSLPKCILKHPSGAQRSASHVLSFTRALGIFVEWSGPNPGVTNKICLIDR